MAETNHFSERLREPLNETTRKARRNLMGAALIGIVITKVGLVPEKISAFGVEFTSANQHALLMLLIAAILYFALGFIVYAYSELTAWQIIFTSKEIEALKEEIKDNTLKKTSVTAYSSLARINEEENNKFKQHVRFLYFRSKPTFYLRLSVELLIPIIFAAYSSYSLATFDLHSGAKATSETQVSANNLSSKDATRTYWLEDRTYLEAQCESSN